MRWMDPLRADCAGVVITGDLNAPPGEGTHLALRRGGYSSASQLANGGEPKVTWPSGLVAPLMDEGEPHCAGGCAARALCACDLQLVIRLRETRLHLSLSPTSAHSRTRCHSWHPSTPARLHLRPRVTRLQNAGDGRPPRRRRPVAA
jgi:hypothetical protein